MHELLFHPAVNQEVKASYRWYERQADGLGDDFIFELESAYEAILELPSTWPVFQGNSRRFVLGRFPFSIIYALSNNSLLVVAVMHHSKKPGYWESRT